MKTLSTKGRCDRHGEDSSYFLGWQEYEKNPYHQVLNPSGIIQMGLAENQLSFDLLESWFCSNPDAYGFTEHGRSIFRELALFQDYHGLPSLKRALADFMGEIRGNRARFDPDKIVLTAGATSANEILTFCIAEPGEAFLVPTPYYPGFNRDLKWRTGVEIVSIQCSSWNDFRITEPALEDAYQRADRKLGLKVKGVLITNPSNPLGTTMTLQELHLLISFAAKNNLHIISDEIYSGTVFNPPSFTSIVEALELHLEDRKRKPPAPTDDDIDHHQEEEDRTHHRERDEDISNFVHVVYSLSKDLGLPGFRVGLIYSNNRRITEAATKMSSFGLISSQTQHLISNILSDPSFTGNYIEENRRRIRERKTMLVMGLEKAGIGCLKSNAGLFCWADMRDLLTENSFEAEESLWKKMIYEVGLNVSPGSSCHCSEPGWFRICFANISTQDLNLAMLRVKAFVDSKRFWIERRLTLSRR